MDDSILLELKWSKILNVPTALPASSSPPFPFHTLRLVCHSLYSDILKLAIFIIRSNTKCIVMGSKWHNGIQQ